MCLFVFLEKANDDENNAMMNEIGIGDGSEGSDKVVMLLWYLISNIYLI
jgi:hypothetical protein